MAYSLVGADPFADHADIGVEQLTDACQLVHEGDARRQHRISGILTELCRGDIHDDQPVVVEHEGGVDLFHDVDGSLVFGADDDSVGFHEVVDGAPFLEEFWI